uniref:Little elongation complex subunit 1 C-terminal domain-containing protein n=1 Tax=Leptobrachium leishanense TaxID=445787 RepID=A0A8C5WEQ7_9ANUR
MMPGEAQSKPAGIASEAAEACQNCTTMQQNLNEYITALIALKQKMIDSDQLLTEYQQKREELNYLERENETLRCQLEQMLQKIAPQEKNQEELKCLREQLEEKTCSLKIYQETQLEYVRLKEECAKNNAIKKKLEAKLKKLEESSVKRTTEFRQLRTENTTFQKKLEKAQKRISHYQVLARKNAMRNAQTQVSNGEPGLNIDKSKIKHLLEQLWQCIDSSTDKDKIELKVIGKRGKRCVDMKSSDDGSMPPSHSNPLASSQIQIEELGLPVIKASKKESKYSDDTATDCNGDSAFYEDKTTEIVPRDFVNDCSQSYDHEEDSIEFLQLLEWAKPLPPLLSPIHVFCPVMQDLFGKWTDSSDEEPSPCSETLPSQDNEKDTEASEKTVSLKDQENRICSLNLADVSEEDAEIKGSLDCGKNDEDKLIKKTPGKTETHSENCNNFVITNKMPKMFPSLEPLQMGPGFTKGVDYERLSLSKVNIVANSGISLQPKSKKSGILTENTNTNKQDSALSKKTCLQSFDPVKGHQLNEPALTEIKSVESCISENDHEECRYACDGETASIDVGMDLIIQDDVLGDAHVSNDYHSKLLCDLSYISSVNSNVSEGKCNADELLSSIQNSKESLPYGTVYKADSLHAQQDNPMDVHQDLDEDVHQVLDEDVHQDLDEDVHQDLDEDVHQDLDEDVHQDLDEDVHQDLDEDVHQDLDEDVHQDLDEDVHQDLDEDVHQDLDEDVHQDLDEDVHQDLDEDVHQDLDEDVHQDLDEDVHQQLESIANPSLRKPNNYNLAVLPKDLGVSSASEHRILDDHENIQFVVQPNNLQHMYCTENLEIGETVKSCSEGEYMRFDPNLSKEISVASEISTAVMACKPIDNQKDKSLQLENPELNEILLEPELLAKKHLDILTSNQELANPNRDTVKERSELGDNCKSSSSEQNDTKKNDVLNSLQNDHFSLEHTESNMPHHVTVRLKEKNNEPSSVLLQCSNRSGFSKAALHPESDVKADCGQAISDHEINVEQSERRSKNFNRNNSSFTDTALEKSMNPDQNSQGVTAAEVKGVLDQENNNREVTENAADKTALASSNVVNISTEEQNVTDPLSRDTSKSESCMLAIVTESLNIELLPNALQTQQESFNGIAECISQPISAVPNAEVAYPADANLVVTDVCISTVPSAASDGDSKSEETDQKNIYRKPFKSLLGVDISPGEGSSNKHTESVIPVPTMVEEKVCLLDTNRLRFVPAMEEEHFKGSPLKSSVPNCALGVTKFSGKTQAGPCLENDTDESEDEVLVRKVSFKTTCSTIPSKNSHSIDNKCLKDFMVHKNDRENSVTGDQTSTSEVGRLTSDPNEKIVDSAVRKSLQKEGFGIAAFCNFKNDCLRSEVQNPIPGTSLSLVNSSKEFLKSDLPEVQTKQCELDNSKCNFIMDLMTDQRGEGSSVLKPSEAKSDDASSKSLVQNSFAQSTASTETNRRITPSKNLIWNSEGSGPDLTAVSLPIKLECLNRKSLASRLDSLVHGGSNTNSTPNRLEPNPLTHSVPRAQVKIFENSPHRLSVGRTPSQVTILANADTSTRTELSPEMVLNKVRSEMGPPLQPLLDPLLTTPPRFLQPFSPILSSSSRSSLPSPLDDLLSPLRETPIQTLMSPLLDNRRYKSPDFTTPSPSDKVDGRILSSPLQFCAATPKHALPVPGRLPPSAAGSSVSAVQENSVKILDTMYPELSARARTLNILKGNVQLNRCLPGDCKTAPLNKITGFKAISSNSTAFIKTGSNLKADGRDQQSGCDSPKRTCNKRAYENIRMPKSAKRLQLDSDSPSKEVIKDYFSVPSINPPVEKKAEEVYKVDCPISDSLPEVAGDIQVDDAVTNAFKKIEEWCFDLLPVIRSHIHVGTIPSIPVMRNEEKEVICEFSSTKKDLAEHFLHALLMKLKTEKSSLDSKYLQALCRVYVGLCRQLGDMERARVLCYSILKEGFPEPDKLLLFIISAWNNIFSMHGIICKAIQSLLKHLAKEDVLHCLSAYLNWEKNPPLPIATILSSVLMAVQLCPDVKFHVSKQYGEDLTDHMWEYVFAVDLLCGHQKWVWTQDHVIRKELWPILDKYVKHKKGRVTIPCVPDIIVATVLRLVGRLCQIGLKEGFVTAVKNVSSVIVAFIQQAKEEDIPWGVQLASVYVLCDVAPCDPDVVYKTLQTWTESASNAIPPAIKSYLAEIASLCMEGEDSIH